MTLFVTFLVGIWMKREMSLFQKCEHKNKK